MQSERLKYPRCCAVEGDRRTEVLSLRSRIEKARKIANNKPDSQHRINVIKTLLPSSGSKLDAKRRRFLEGMHKDKHEAQSITIASPTAHFERDRMLYYKAIQETSIAPLDFISTLRMAGPRPDDTCTRQQQLRKAKVQFAKAVSTKQAVASKSRGNCLETWSSFHEHTTNRKLVPDTSHQYTRKKYMFGRRCTPPGMLPATPVDAPPVSFPGQYEQLVAADFASAVSSGEMSQKAAGTEVYRLEVDQQQQGAANELSTVEECEVANRSRSRSPSRCNQAGRTAPVNPTGVSSTPPVNPQSWAAANTAKSNRYQQLAALQLTPNVAIRPDHGCAWDIHDGTHNILISDDAVDTRTLQDGFSADPEIAENMQALLEGGWLQPRAPEGQQRGKEQQPRGRFLKEAKRKLLTKAAAACNPVNAAPKSPEIRFADLEDSHGCSGGVVREWLQPAPFLEWIHACNEAAKRPAATAAALNNGIVTSSIKRRNNFLMPVFDDGTGEPEIAGHSKDNLAFRKGRLGVVQYMQDRPEAITWERPFQYASRQVRENVTDAIEKAKLLRMFDRQLVPVAARSRGRMNA